MKRTVLAAILSTAVAGGAFAQSAQTPAPAGAASESVVVVTPAAPPGKLRENAEKAEKAVEKAAEKAEKAAEKAADKAEKSIEKADKSVDKVVRSDASADKAALKAAVGPWLGTQIWKQEVYDPSLKRIGEIDNLVVLQNGQISEAVIGVGGFLGIGEKSVAIPFGELKAVARDSKIWFVLDRTKDQLMAAPSFDASKFKY